MRRWVSILVLAGVALVLAVPVGFGRWDDRDARRREAERELATVELVDEEVRGAPPTAPPRDAGPALRTIRRVLDDRALSPSPSSGDESSPASGPEVPPFSTDVAEEHDVALMTGLLEMGEFGATVGLLLTCQTGTGALAAAAAEAGLGDELLPVLAEIPNACAQLSDAAVEQIAAMHDAVLAMESLDPATNAFLDAARQFQTALAALTDQTGPLDPLVDALGPMIDFFRG
jgi:hypothetical protein